MLEYDRNYRSVGTDVNNTDGSQKCIICNYWYFFEIKFRFQPEVCNSRHGLIQNAMSFNNDVIVSVKGNDCRIHFLYMCKYETTNFFKKY